MDTNERQFEAQLMEIFGEQIDLQLSEDDPDVYQECLMEVSDQRSFEDTGLLTNDRGVVVTLTNGSKFNLTIQRAN
jgi:hypothetical protein